jgi:uncharacterized damage-inducible protein DinB
MDRTRRPLVLDDAVGLLARTPVTLDTWLRDLPDGWATANEGGDTWSVSDVVAHLTHTERTNWMPRVKLLLEHGEARAFDEFDRFGHLTGQGGETLAARLDEFTAVRQDSLRQLAALGLVPADLERRGKHPALGAVKLRQLLAAWVTHDLDHVFQVARVLACQYTEEVGPWRQYLRIVRDAPAES